MIVKSITRKVLNYAKHIVFERGNLIYYLNIPSFTHSIEKIESKGKKDKINIAFLCQCPNIWTTVQPIYQAALDDGNFNVSVILIPEMDFSYYVFLKSVNYQKVYEFGKEIGEECIVSYNPDTKEWLDLEKLALDYVFIPRPYETYLPKQYRASAIRKYAKVCYVPYAFPLLGDFHIIYNTHFARNVYMFLCEKKQSYDYIMKKFHNTCKKHIQCAYFTGYPRFDLIEEHQEREGLLWKRERSNEIMRIIWTPRWTVDPKLGGSNFFEYKDKIIEYAEEHREVDLLFRPHPMAFDNFIAQGLISEEEVENYCARYSASDNAVLDQTPEYFDTFYSSDVLVSDLSSVMVDYLFTGKPIIYCPSSKEGYGIFKELLDCFYVVEDFEELTQTLEQIRSGKDYKQDVRRKMVQFLKRDGKIGKSIVDIIKEDYWKQEGPK